MAVFLFPSDVIGATTWTVANCSQATNDPSNSTINHTGVLRYVIAHAADGDTIDLSQLACSTITLVDGEECKNYHRQRNGHVARSGQKRRGKSKNC